jgi:TMEM175 potassium channel family protein
MPVFPRGADEEDMPDIDRLLALTDGVVAIALTLLVLQLRVPELTSNMDSARALWHALDVDGGELTSYLISFVVIAQFWLVHHRILRTMRGHSEGLAWRNFGFLLALTLMPFTSDLMGRYASNPLAVTFFAINLLALSLSTQWIYVYAISHHLVVDKRRSSYEERLGRVRATLTIVVVSIAVVLAWTATSVVRYVWLLFLVVPVLGARIASRAEPEQPAQASAGR